MEKGIWIGEEVKLRVWDMNKGRFKIEIGLDVGVKVSVWS